MSARHEPHENSRELGTLELFNRPEMVPTIVSPLMTIYESGGTFRREIGVFAQLLQLASLVSIDRFGEVAGFV
jgi:hypothetical protein